MNSLNFWNYSADSLAAYGEYSHVLAARNREPYIPVNALSSALSPYLRSHALDPIGWQEWTDATFQAALREDRPIFVSAGYHGNHWCNVMARDCWLDNEVAGLLNSSFIPVMVDLQERPDLDALLTELCRLQNGSAGYPLNAFLTGEGRVFFAATWLPKRTMGEVPGLTELLPRVKWLWHMQRNDISREADELHKLFSGRLLALAGSKHRTAIKHSTFEAISSLRKVFNLHWGGWGGVPRFPQYPAILFLLMNAQSGIFSATEKSDALTMVDITLRRIWRGGIHDHLGGGFHHYAVDERWQVPHFEKLLCEQALMLLNASLMQEIDPKPFNRLLAEDIIFCALHDFADDNTYSQAFRASIDADTIDGEARFYLWTEHEIKSLLPQPDASLFCSAYGALPSGNFAPEFGGSQMGQNILYEASTVTELANRYGIRPADVGDILTRCRKLLLDYRAKRYPLKTDNKIIMAWNGLMIAALARASVSFDEPEWRDLAERTAMFLRKNLQDKNNSLYRNWFDGHRWGLAQCEDYAYFLWGVLELYKACKHFGAPDKQLSEWLACAKTLADGLCCNLWDDDKYGLFLTQDNSIASLRLKSPEDGSNYSLPNANAVAAMTLSELAQITEDKSLSDKAKHIIDCFSLYASDNPLPCLTLLTANSLWKSVKLKKLLSPPQNQKILPTDEELNQPQEAPTIQQETPTTIHTLRKSEASSRRRSQRPSRRRANSAL